MEALHRALSARLEEAATRARDILEDVTEDITTAATDVVDRIAALRAKKSTAQSPDENISPNSPNDWREDEAAHWQTEKHTQPRTTTMPKHASQATLPAACAPAISTEVATARLRKSLFLREARLQEEAEANAEATANTEAAVDGELTSVHDDEDASNSNLPWRRDGFEDDDDTPRAEDYETSRRRDAATARAAALEDELAVLQRRLHEAEEAAKAPRSQNKTAVEEDHPASSSAGRRRAGKSGADADATLCVVCLEEERTHVLIPCGHRCLCAKCAARYEEHMRFDGTGGSSVETDADDGATGKKAASGKKGGAGKRAAGGGRAPGGCSSSGGMHTCPLCRKAVTGVHLVWE